jgi:hypothetical protein
MKLFAQILLLEADVKRKMTHSKLNVNSFDKKFRKLRKQKKNRRVSARQIINLVPRGTKKHKTLKETMIIS